MRSPQEKYLHDPEYRQLVDILEAEIHRARFTPSEIREAALFACIRYEMHERRYGTATPLSVHRALKTLDEFARTEEGEPIL